MPPSPQLVAHYLVILHERVVCLHALVHVSQAVVQLGLEL
jgi:hypothetical protein